MVEWKSFEINSENSKKKFRDCFSIFIINSFKCQPHKMVKDTQTRRLWWTNCLSVFDHFVGLVLKGLTWAKFMIFLVFLKVISNILSLMRNLNPTPSRQRKYQNSVWIWRRFDVFISIFEQISHIAMVFSFLTSNK